MDLGKDFLFQEIDFKLIEEIEKNFLRANKMIDARILQKEIGSEHVVCGSFKTTISNDIHLPDFEQFKMFIKQEEAYERHVAVCVVSVKYKSFSYSILKEQIVKNKHKTCYTPVYSYEHKERYTRPYNFLVIQEIDSLDDIIFFERKVEIEGLNINTHLQMTEGRCLCKRQTNMN
ncbi:MAG: hypothetical protein M3P22_00945 [bacterium]|nr:hypothetical protein [bacterium]